MCVQKIRSFLDVFVLISKVLLVPSIFSQGLRALNFSQVIDQTPEAFVSTTRLTNYQVDKLGVSEVTSDIFFSYTMPRILSPK